MTDRKEGYYWVISNNKWMIALFQSEVWFFAGDWHYYEDASFDEIDEHRIPTPDERNNKVKE